MTTPKDIIPTKYEVIKLNSGTEIVGMTRDLGDSCLLYTSPSPRDRG